MLSFSQRCPLKMLEILLSRVVNLHLSARKELPLFNTLKYFRMLGQKEFPSIATLVRIHFSKMDNGAEQERVFSTAANAQRKKLTRMKFDMLEKRTLFAHNKDLIKSGVL